MPEVKQIVLKKCRDIFIFKYPRGKELEVIAAAFEITRQAESREIDFDCFDLGVVCSSVFGTYFHCFQPSSYKLSEIKQNY